MAPTTHIGAATPVSLGGDDATPHYPLQKPVQQSWSFAGPFGKWDIGQLQRGLKVYTEVCAACHSLDMVSYRNLADLGYSDAQIKNFAAEVEESLIRATKTWELEKMKAKEHETQSEQEESDGGENEDEYEDSFIADSEDAEYSEREKPRKKKKEENQILIDLDKWGNDKQLDSLI